MFASIRMKAVAVVAGALLGAAAPAAEDTAESWADIIVTELAQGRPMPALSQYHDALNLDSAYAIQRALVEAALETRRIGGYKAGFMTAEAQRKYRLAQPVSGVLFADGRREDGVTIDAADFRQLTLEVELGFVLRSPIRRRMRSVADLKTYVSHVVPAIELPDLNYASPATLRGLDIVATNVAAGAYLVGKPLALRDLALVNAIDVALYRDDQLIERARAADVMGNQLEALLWLVNEVQARGWPLRPGQLLLTGALGKMHPGLPGHYRADYGRDAGVSFTIAAPAAKEDAPR